MANRKTRRRRPNKALAPPKRTWTGATTRETKGNRGPRGVRAGAKRRGRGRGPIYAALALGVIAAAVILTVADLGGDSKLRLSKGSAVVAKVIDGDTISLEDGRRVRLVQIDTPEVSERECYADQATRALERTLPEGALVDLVHDPRLDDTDHYGRLLRYVIRRGHNVNLAQVRRGAASVWFVDGDRGRYAKQFLAGAKRARTRRTGLWGSCPGTRLNTAHGVQTGG